MNILKGQSDLGNSFIETSFSCDSRLHLVDSES